MNAPCVYRLTAPLCVVRIRAEAQGEVVRLDAGSQVTLKHPTSIPGFVEIEHNREAYSVFESDLFERADKISTAAM